MIIIWGIRRRLTRMGVVFALCSSCQTPAAQVLGRVRTWFALFFIPIIPLGSHYRTTCTMCGTTLRVTKETATQLMGSIVQQHQQQQPQPLPQPAALGAAPQMQYAQPAVAQSAGGAPAAMGDSPYAENLDDIQITLHKPPPRP